MEYKWLNRENNEKVIIFFNGWGMDENAVSGMAFDEFDVVMFYDYNNLDTDFDFNELNSYKEKSLVAWSMGVMVATLFKEKLEPLKTKTAINGTLKPIDAEFGINPRIYDLTIRGFNEVGREKFIRNMFDSEIKELPAINRELENQKSELSAIKNYGADFDFKYNKVFISDNDKIIPTKNQCKYWILEPNLKGGHCVKFESWSELV